MTESRAISCFVWWSASRDLARLEREDAPDRAVEVVLEMENAPVTVLTDSILYIGAELEELIPTLEQEAKGHAWIQITHVDRPRSLLAVVEVLLPGEILRKVDLWVDVVRVKEHQSVGFIVFGLLRFTILSNWLEIVIHFFLSSPGRLLKVPHEIVSKARLTTDKADERW